MMLGTPSVTSSRMKALLDQKQPVQTVNDIIVNRRFTSYVKSIAMNMQFKKFEIQPRLGIPMSIQ